MNIRNVELRKNKESTLNKRIIILSLLDFPNGLGNTMRVKMIGKAFVSIGYKVSLLMAYAPGTVSKGLNQSTEGIFEGIEFKYCNGGPDPPRGYLSLLYLKTIGLIFVLKEIWKLNKVDYIKFLYLYGTHGTVFYEDISYWVISRIIGAKIILDVNDASQEGIPMRFGSSLIRYWLRKLKHIFIRVKGNFTISHADYLFYVSKYLKDDIEKKKKLSAKMLFVPMLIDSVAIEGIKCDRGTGKKIIGYAGFIKDYEGLDFLLESLVKLKLAKSFSEFICYLYGATQSNVIMVNRLQKMISELGLKEHVFIKDSVSQDTIYQTLVDCDVLVVPRRSNVITLSGFSQKFGDYLLSGVSVVSTAVGEVVNMLESGKNIVFTPEGDTDAFAKAIHNLLEDKNKAMEIGLNGRKFVTENFDFRIVARHIEALLES